MVSTDDELALWNLIREVPKGPNSPANQQAFLTLACLASVASLSLREHH